MSASSSDDAPLCGSTELWSVSVGVAVSSVVGVAVSSVVPASTPVASVIVASSVDAPSTSVVCAETPRVAASARTAKSASRRCARRRRRVPARAARRGGGMRRLAGRLGDARERVRLVARKDGEGKRHLRALELPSREIRFRRLLVSAARRILAPLAPR